MSLGSFPLVSGYYLGRRALRWKMLLNRLSHEGIGNHLMEEDGAGLA
jgi:hypothetical protein